MRSYLEPQNPQNHRVAWNISLHQQKNPQRIWGASCLSAFSHTLSVAHQRASHDGREQEIVTLPCVFLWRRFGGVFLSLMIIRSENFCMFSRWWFQIFCYVHPEPWGNDPVWLDHIFQMGWNHQTSFELFWYVVHHYGDCNCPIILATLPKTNSLPMKTGHPKWKGSSSNHQFSGAMLITVSFREGTRSGEAKTSG